MKYLVVVILIFQSFAFANSRCMSRVESTPVSAKQVLTDYYSIEYRDLVKEIGEVDHKIWKLEQEIKKDKRLESKIKKEINILENKKTELEEKLEKVESKEKRKFLAKLKEKYQKSSDEVREYLDAMLLRLKLYHFSDDDSVIDVSVVENDLPTIEPLIRALLESGYGFIFDAPKELHARLRKLVGDRGVILTAGSKSTKDQVAISNKYSIVELAGRGKFQISSLSTPMSVSVFLNQGISFTPSDEAKSSAELLSDWQKWLEDSDKNMNIKPWSIPFKFKNGQAFAEAKYESGKRVFKKVSPGLEPSWEVSNSLTWSDFSHDVLHDALQTADIIMQKSKLLPKVPGAVLFGSANLDPQFVDIAYDISYSLASQGVAISTGGSGGAMVTANIAAYDAGGISIGIPIGGKHLLESEKTSFTDFHTTTITTFGYETRIPLLVENKQLYVFVPGGSGTMKELAVVLNMFESGTNSGLIVLSSQVYYKGLFDWLQQSNLSEFTKSRIVLVDNVEQLNFAIQTAVDNKLIEADKLFGEKPDSPRTSRQRFPRDMFKKELEWRKNEIIKKQASDYEGWL